MASNVENKIRSSPPSFGQFDPVGNFIYTDFIDIQLPHKVLNSIKFGGYQEELLFSTFLHHSWRLLVYWTQLTTLNAIFSKVIHLLFAPVHDL